MSTKIFGTIERPFNSKSIWYAKPINSVFDSFVIPPSYQPNKAAVPTNISYIDITSGSWSCGIYEASEQDAPITIYKLDGSAGINHKDLPHVVNSITIPRWPSNAEGAPEADGHCDVYDAKLGGTHSLWEFKIINGVAKCSQYAFSPSNGHGHGFGAQAWQGARATSVPTSAGMIRKHEINDGLPSYDHALAVALDFQALGKGYEYPATSCDVTANLNTGKVQQGALLMLPPSYDVSRCDRWPELKKIAVTLATYGARVVDRNTNCPMTVYVQRDCGFKLNSGTTGWDSAMQAELENIRLSLRMVSSATFIDSTGATYTKPKRINLYSMRGPWRRGGVVESVFDTYTQSVVLPVEAGTWKDDSTGFKHKDFAPVKDKFYKVYHETDCSASAKLTFYKWDASKNTSVVAGNTGSLKQFQTCFLKWPEGGWYFAEISKPITGKGGYSKLLFIEIEKAEYDAGSNKVIL